MTAPARRAVLSTTAAGLAGSLAGCIAAPRGTVRPTTTQATLSTDATYGYTHVRPTGNRYLPGRGSVRDADPVDVPVDGTPAWVVALPAAEGSYWLIATRQGAVSVVHVAGGTQETVREPAPLPDGMPPLGRNGDGGPGLVRPPDGAAELTHPVVTPGGLLSVAGEGDLVLAGDGEPTRFAVDAPPDARIVRLDDRRYATLGAATDRYRHGALGDTVEGGSVLVVDVVDREVVVERAVGPPAVVEGLSPIVADVDGNGRRELVVTTATSSRGARVEALAPDGRRVAAGPRIGSGGWRHQLCVAPFAGEPELAVVRKPHVEHLLEFYRRDGDRLRVVATLPGFRTHTYGSRNLDGALAADLDGDGDVELLAPRTDRRRLAAVERTGDGARIEWTLALGGALRSNVAGVGLADDGLAVGAATAEHLRVWPG